MRKTIDEIKAQVQKECLDPAFKHHKWYWEHHIMPMMWVALKLADEVGVNRELIELVVYLHDIAKIRGLDDHASEGARIADEMLPEMPKRDLIIKCIASHNKPSENDPVAVKLIAAADAVSHFLSPFFEIYIWENPDLDFNWLCESNIRKAEKDWKRILLPEAREMAREAYQDVIKRYEVQKQWQ